jgi:hypothetical protein
MATWDELYAAAPEIGAVGRALLEQHNLAYLATTRRDGAPRVHPVAPFVLEGRLFVATPPSSPKAYDQIRDGRYAMHMLPGKDDDEFRIRGRATLLADGPRRAMVLKDGPHWVKGDDCIFEYDIEEAATAYWVNVGQPGTYPVRKQWKAPG